MQSVLPRLKGLITKTENYFCYITLRLETKSLIIINASFVRKEMINENKCSQPTKNEKCFSLKYHSGYLNRSP